MAVDWLYRTTLEMSLLIGLVLLARPLVRRTLGARAAYWLWFIPVLRALFIDRPEWPHAVVERIGVPGGEISLTIYPSPDVWILPSAVPWQSIWIAGALLWIALRVTGAIRFRRMLASDSSAVELPAALAALVPEHLQRRVPSYFMTDVPGTPFVTGLWRPLVYLPTDFFQRFTVDEQCWVVQHELTHAMRGDLWVQSLWEALRSVFWFNPIVHFAANAMRNDQELACDQAVLSGRNSEERYSYGRTLLVGAGASLFPSLLSFFGNQKERIAMIGSHKASRRRDLIGIAMCAVVGVFALTKAPVSVADLVSENPITLNFQQLPINKMVQLIKDFSGIPTEIVGLEQLGDRTISIQVQGVPAREALQVVLNCAGFTYEERGETVAIVPLTGNAAGAVCVGNARVE